MSKIPSYADPSFFNFKNGEKMEHPSGHNIVLNWITEITDLLQFFVVSVKFGSDYASREVVLSF